MPTAEIVTIGTELLLGEIVDTNSTYLARALKDAGIDLYRTTTIGDNTARIAQAIREAAARADIIITTGGLGPTVDDPTRQAIAAAVRQDVVFVPELWDQIQARFQRFGRQATDNNKRQAFIPQGATPIENPVGTAPAFLVETGNSIVISLPGVPKEMEYLVENSVLPILRERYNLNGTIKSVVLHVASVGESVVDELIGDLEELSNPTVGLAAHPGEMDIRITAKASSPSSANEMIAGVAQTLRDRLGRWIYGQDDETLEQVVLRGFSETGQTLTLVASGMGTSVGEILSNPPGMILGMEQHAEPLDQDQLRQKTLALYNSLHPSIAFGVSLRPDSDRYHLDMMVISRNGATEHHRSYGSAPQNAQLWATNVCLEMLRRAVLSIHEPD